VGHQLLEDRLAGGERLGGRLGRLEIRALGSKRASGGGHLGGLGRGQVGGTATSWSAPPVIPAWSVVPAGWPVSVWAVLAAGRPVTVWAVLAARCGGVPRSVLARTAVVSRRTILSRPLVAAWRTIVAAWRAVAVRAILPGPILTRARRGWGKRHGGRGLTLRRGTTEGRAWGGHDPGGLRAHAEDAPAARGQDLEVQIVELGPKGFARQAKGLLDGLSGEFAVLTH
jgi:hypothetical protein